MLHADCSAVCSVNVPNRKVPNMPRRIRRTKRPLPATAERKTFVTMTLKSLSIVAKQETNSLWFSNLPPDATFDLSLSCLLCLCELVFPIPINMKGNELTKMKTRQRQKMCLLSQKNSTEKVEN